jgi:hypothetical protein
VEHLVDQVQFRTLAFTKHGLQEGLAHEHPRNSAGGQKLRVAFLAEGTLPSVEKRDHRKVPIGRHGEGLEPSRERVALLVVELMEQFLALRHAKTTHGTVAGESHEIRLERRQRTQIRLRARGHGA